MDEFLMSVPRTRSRALVILAAVIALILVAGGAIVLTRVPQSPLYVGPRPYTQTVVDGQLNLGTRYYAVNFTVPDRATQIRITTNFTARGGPGDDIKFYVLTSDNLLRWANHQPYIAVYETGQIRSLNQVINLPSPGYYSLVYDNSFSFLSTKTVLATATLTYLL